MTAKGHILLALALAAPISYNINHTEVFLSALTLGAIFPDIDEPESSIGHKVIILPHIIKRVFGHRGFTHRFIIPYLLFMSSLAFAGATQIAVFGFAFGYLAHTVGDMLTKSGIDNYFWPMRTGKIALLPLSLRFKTGGMVEYILIGCLALLNVVLYYRFIPAKFSGI